MTDGIIKGTGDSRYLKSVLDFRARYPTYNAFADALAEGSVPIDLNGINTAGWTQQGTPLNKTNLLSDDTEVRLWGSLQDRTIDQALRTLRDNALDYATKPGDIYTTARTDLGDKWLLCNGADFDTNAEGYASEKLKELKFPLATSGDTLAEASLGLLVSDGDTVISVNGSYVVVMDGVDATAPTLVYKWIRNGKIGNYGTMYAGDCYDGVWVLVGFLSGGVSMLVSRNPRDPESWVEKEFPVSFTSVRCHDGLWVAVSSGKRDSEDSTSYSPVYVTTDPFGDWEHASDVGMAIQRLDYDGKYWAAARTTGVVYATDIHGPWTAVTGISDLTARDLVYASSVSKWILLSSTTGTAKIHTAATPDGTWTTNASANTTADYVAQRLALVGSYAVMFATYQVDTTIRYNVFYRSLSSVSSSGAWSTGTYRSIPTTTNFSYYATMFLTNGGYYFSPLGNGTVVRSTAVNSAATFRHSVPSVSATKSCATDGVAAVLTGYYSLGSGTNYTYYPVVCMSVLGETTWRAYVVGEGFTATSGNGYSYSALAADGKWLLAARATGSSAIHGWLFTDFFEKWDAVAISDDFTGTVTNMIYVDGVWCISAQDFIAFTAEDPSGAWTRRTIPHVSATSASGVGTLAADENGTVVYSAVNYYLVCEDIRVFEWEEVRIPLGTSANSVSYSHGYWIRIYIESSSDAAFFYTKDLFGTWSQSTKSYRTRAVFYATGRWWLLCLSTTNSQNATILVDDNISGSFTEIYGGETINYGYPILNVPSLVVFNGGQDFIYAYSTGGWGLRQSAVQQLPTIEADQAYAYIKVKE